MQQPQGFRRQHRLQLARRFLQDEIVAHDPGAMDDAVERAVIAHDTIDQCRHRRLVGDVGLNVLRARAQRLERPHLALAGFAGRRAPGQHQRGRRRLLRDLPREDQPQPARAAGDQVDAAGLPRLVHGARAGRHLLPAGYPAAVILVADMPVLRHAAVCQQLLAQAIALLRVVQRDQLAYQVGVFQVRRFQQAAQPRHQLVPAQRGNDDLEQHLADRPGLQYPLDFLEGGHGVALEVVHHSVVMRSDLDTARAGRSDHLLAGDTGHIADHHHVLDIHGLLGVRRHFAGLPFRFQQHGMVLGMGRAEVGGKPARSEADQAHAQLAVRVAQVDIEPAHALARLRASAGAHQRPHAGTAFAQDIDALQAERKRRLGVGNAQRQPDRRLQRRVQQARMQQVAMRLRRLRRRQFQPRQYLPLAHVHRGQRPLGRAVFKAQLAEHRVALRRRQFGHAARRARTGQIAILRRRRRAGHARGRAVQHRLAVGLAVDFDAYRAVRFREQGQVQLGRRPLAQRQRARPADIAQLPGMLGPARLRQPGARHFQVGHRRHHAPALDHMVGQEEFLAAETAAKARPRHIRRVALQ